MVTSCIRSSARGLLKRKACMTVRSRREVVTFRHSFQIRGVDRLLPAGHYEVITDDEMIEGLSFAAFRRISHDCCACLARLGDGDDLHWLGRSGGCAAYRREHAR